MPRMELFHEMHKLVPNHIGDFEDHKSKCLLFQTNKPILSEITIK